MVAICVVNQSQPEQDMMPFRTTVRLLNADGTVMGDHEFYGYRQHDQHNVNVRVYIPRQLAQDNINGNQGKINVSIDLISIINEVDDGYGWLHSTRICSWSPVPDNQDWWLWLTRGCSLSRHAASFIGICWLVHPWVTDCTTIYNLYVLYTFTWQQTS